MTLITWLWGRGDIHRTARLIGERLSGGSASPSLENRAGANAAAEAVVRAPADGYTLLLAHAVNAINATLYDKLISLHARPHAGCRPRAGSPCHCGQSVVPARTVPELIAYARAIRQSLHGGTRGLYHCSGSRIRSRETGLDLAHVPYPGDGPAIKD